MSNLNIRIFGSANLSQVSGEFSKLEAQVTRLNAAMAAQVNQRGLVDPEGFKRMNAEITRSSQIYRNALASTGMFRVEQLRVNSATDNYTKALQNQKLGLRDLIRQQKLASAAYKEQIAMQQMVVRTSMAGNFNGKRVIDVSFPDRVNEQLNTFGNRLGWANEQMRSLSTQTVNWGKNTQWAGRQLMTGFTIPVAAAGAGMAVLAYQADQQLTRIAKVYDVYAQDQAGKEKELAKLRTDSLYMGAKAAETYGASLKDTLQVEAELAATGLNGNNLRQATMETIRIATLGELQYSDAINTTIALQNAFKLSNEDLTDTFNYMNSVENATSLSIQDIAEATPRAASAMAGLNVTAKEMTVLLVAMKERGIDAAEGANALKSATTRILSPVKAASTYFAQFGININKMSTDSGGNLYEFLQLLSEATKEMSTLDKQRGIAKLFGTYQYNRLNGALQGITDSMFDMGDQASQTKKAVDLLSKDSTYLAEQAQQELDRAGAQVSTRFKKSLESLKVQLTEAGMPFLEIGNAVLSVVLKIVKAFNGLPDGAQKFAIITAILLAATGPAIMLVGLTANLIGNFMKMGVSIVGMLTKFELMTKEQRAAQLAAKFAEQGFISERQALANLTSEMQKYALAQQAANRSIMNRVNPSTMAAPSSTPGSMSGTFTGGWMPANVAAAQANNATASKVAADAAEKQKTALRSVAESGGLFATAMVASAVSSNETVDNVANIAMLAAIAGPALLGMARGLMAVKWAEIGSSIAGKWTSGTAAVAGNASKFSTAFKGASGVVGKTGFLVRGLGAGIAGLISPVGLVMAAVAAGAVAWKVISDNADKTRKSVEAMNNNPEALGKILGYTPKQEGSLDATSKKASDINDRVIAMRENFGAVIDQIKSATDETDKFNIAMSQIGLQVIDSGGTVDEAKEAVRLALQAAGTEAKRADAIVIRFQTQFDPKGQAEQAVRAATLYAQKAQEKWQAKGFSERLKDPKTDASREAMQWGEDAGNKMAQGIKIALDNNLGQADNLTAMDKVMKPLVDRATEIAEIQKRRMALGEGADISLIKEAEANQTLVAAMKRRILTELAGEKVAKEFNDDQLFRMSNTELLGKATIAVSDADREAYLNTKNLSGANMTLAEAQELSAREANKNADAQKKTADGMNATGAAAANAGTDLDQLTAKFKDANEAYTAYAGAIQSGTKAAMSEYADQAQTNFQNRMNAAMDAYKASQDARMDALRGMQEKASRALDARQDADNKRLESSQKAANRRLDAAQDAQDEALEKRQDARRDAIEKSFDSRIDKIKATMDMEKRAEDQRQAIFEAEMTRISRLAEVANRNIDFNAALNSGNMDEAAKIMNDAEAAESQWSLSDANDAAKTAFDKRQDAMGASIDELEKAKQTRLDNIKAVEDAEKKALEASQQRQSDALALQQEREKDALAKRLQAEKDNLNARQKAEQDMLQKRIDANIKGEQRIWDGRKAQLDRAITDFQNFAPRNAAELQKHIQDISGRYDQFRVMTRGKFNGTAADVKSVLQRNITAAMQEVAANKQWETVGADIVTKMTKGAFNMDMNQFVKWVTTGETPKGWTASKTAIDAGARLNAAQQRNKNANDRRLPAYHVGGQIGVDPGGRAGITGSGLHRSEKLIVAQKGEYMVNKDAYSKNKSIVEAINSGADIGGNPHVHKGDAADSSLGFVGMMGAGIAAAASMAIGAALATAASRRISQDAAAIGAGGGGFSAGKPGRYGNNDFNAEQLANASLIATVGSQMGMSARDIQIGIMTAIAESSLKNLKGGDRDSIGLFQQRPSQGWGTPAQIGDPNYAARKFFDALKKVTDRGKMDPWMAAQTVQRSAFSTGSNYKQYWDEANAIFKAFGVGSAQDLGGVYKNAYGRTTWDGEPIDNLTAAQLTVAGRLLGRRYHVTQGSFQPATSYSGTTHTGGGVVDVSPWDNNAVVALQQAGFAAWHRGPGAPGKAANYGHHIHAVSLFDKGVAKSAAAQAAHYRNMSGDGLGQKYYGPHAAVINNLLAQLPKFKDGGFSMSTGLAELHGTKSLPEATLSAPLTQKFKQGVDNFAQGAGDTYNIDVDARGTDLNEREIVTLVIDAIEAKNARKPVSRRGTD